MLSIQSFDQSHPARVPPGFRALLPNVNISFSPFGDSGASGTDALGQVPVAASLGAVGGGVGGLGGLAGFGPFSAAAVDGLTKSSGSVGPQAAVAPFSAGGSFDLSGGGLTPGLGSSALNGGLPGLAAPPSASEVSLLHQLSSSGSLPGAQLPGSQLSSQLQSLLQGANSGASSTIGSGRAVASDTGNSGRWAPGRTGTEGLMPGWDGLLAKTDDGLMSESAHKDQGGMNSARGGKKEGGGGDRGGKGKKRGGTSNRSNKGGEPKPAHGK